MLTQLLLKVGDVSSVLCQSLEHLKPLMQIFIGGIILNNLKKMGSEDP